MDSRLALDDGRRTTSLAPLSSTLTASKFTFQHGLNGLEWSTRSHLGTTHPQHCANPPRTSYPGSMKARTAANKDMTSASGESSADEDVEHPSDAPDADVAYSYDAPKGPSGGSQILNHALEKAVVRFENKETEKLIKNEYEVLDRDSDDEAPKPRRLMPPEDDEYEFIDV
jgi:hypothetical protein